MPYIDVNNIFVSGNISLVPAYVGANFSLTPQVPKLDNAPDPLYNGFGTAIASHGDFIAIGSGRTGTGVTTNSVHIFSRNGSSWSLDAVIPKVDGLAAAVPFGSVLALHGDYLFVGAPSTSATNNSPVYMYRRAGGLWPTTPTATINQTTGTLMQFGASIATDGERVVIGHRSANSNRGLVAIYTISGDTVTLETTLTESASSGSLINYGTSIALLGNELFVGGQGASGTSFGQGRVFYSKRTGTSWSTPVVLSHPFGTTTSGLGASMIARGNRVFVGAPSTRGDTTVGGSVLIYEKVEDVWTPATTIAFVNNTTNTAHMDVSILDSTLNSNAQVSIALAVNPEGTVIIAGAPNYAASAGNMAGAVYAAQEFNGVWGSTAIAGNKLIASPIQNANARFGLSVDWVSSYGEVLVGQPGSSSVESNVTVYK